MLLTTLNLLPARVRDLILVTVIMCPATVITTGSAVTGLALTSSATRFAERHAPTRSSVQP